MNIRRRSLFKLAAGGMLIFMGGAATVTYRHPKSEWLWHAWHQLRFRTALKIRPTRNQDIYDFPRENYTVLASHSRAAEIALLNPTAKRIWEMCNGQSRVCDIVATLAAGSGVEPSRCRRDVVFTLAHFQRLGIVHI